MGVERRPWRGLALSWDLTLAFSWAWCWHRLFSSQSRVPGKDPCSQRHTSVNKQACSWSSCLIWCVARQFPSTQVSGVLNLIHSCKLTPRVPVLRLPGPAQTFCWAPQSFCSLEGPSSMLPPLLTHQPRGACQGDKATVAAGLPHGCGDQWRGGVGGSLCSVPVCPQYSARDS